ncbi:TPA: hypothetical protein ACGN81_005195 [Bacillus cereus]
MTKEQKFNTGYKVKVHTAKVFVSDEWWLKNEIEKVNDSQTQTLNDDQWVWS